MTTPSFTEALISQIPAVQLLQKLGYGSGGSNPPASTLHLTGYSLRAKLFVTNLPSLSTMRNLVGIFLPELRGARGGSQ